MRRLFLTNLLLAIAFFAFAQPNTVSALPKSDPKAKSILDKTTENIKKVSVKVEFTLLVDDLKDKKKTTHKGELLMKGNKFVLKVANMETYFDGKTQWVYVPQDNEVNISNPDKEELQEINPTMLLSEYNNKTALILFDEEYKESSPTYSINIFPEDKKKPFFKINVVINKKTLQLVSIKMFNRDAINTTLTINKYQQIALEDAAFVFNVKKYKGIILNDLR